MATFGTTAFTDYILIFYTSFPIICHIPEFKSPNKWGLCELRGCRARKQTHECQNKPIWSAAARNVNMIALRQHYKSYSAEDHIFGFSKNYSFVDQLLLGFRRLGVFETVEILTLCMVMFVKCSENHKIRSIFLISRSPLRIHSQSLFEE